ncbi:MAG: lauroyl acyltransferase [Proteobacteria bacterium]|nr:lauroyl acyltransferase [Pseudomonadota bacterium]
MSFKEDFLSALHQKGLLKVLRYALEALGFTFLLVIFRCLPLEAASHLGGVIGRTLGPRLGIHRRARKNLARALPEMTQARHEATLLGMWENLGRIIAEYPHLKKFANGKRFIIEGIEEVWRLRDDGKPGIFVGAHLGNWEMSPILTQAHGLPLGIAYRNPNNPFVAALLDFARRPLSPTRMAKGSEGGMALARYLKKGGHLGILVDQKMNEGLKLKFFGRDAMTAPAVAAMALRLDVPMVMIRTQRLKATRFRISFERMPTAGEKNDPAAEAKIMQAINDRLEAWIRDDPAQWLWLHNRWVEEKKA